MSRPPAPATYAQRIAFVCEIAARLHRYGTTAQRLEGSILALSAQLGLDCEPWSNPTGMILSFSDPKRALGASDTTRVIRLAPGENDLYKLSEADRIADAVAGGQMSLAEGHAALRALDQLPTRGFRLMQILAYGLAAGGVAGLWRLPWLDIGTATLIGLLIGVVSQLTDRRPQLREASDAIASLVAGLVAILISNLVGPLNLNSVIITALVVLLPGMSLTNAFNELTSQHWVSGTARFAGAVTTVIKLTVGSIIAVTLAQMLGLYPEVRALRPQPDWVEWGALVISAFAFAVLFKAHRRDYLWVMGAAICGYLISRYAGKAWGSEVGLFLSALVMTALGNAFARYYNRPGALIRLPGIIMLVPGSASLRVLMNLASGESSPDSTLLVVLQILMALVAGLLFGNLLVSARKAL
ncbi:MULTISPECIES: threonine/serine ThrE exporter family protein [Pseudoxanthomonas]|uniref:Threonine/serine exporter family protein n=1 Tax=Pseudoxanthomonas winnipegensis TaxID=2480810 RepID=A0A4Q8LGX1_9GAMM|nr:MULTISPECIES: threonine/serine exporter family protein [Pseudoxanthomonas]TAA28742.1 threonine/serine exporter family protein [Pseudoxanthomonas winnipegensis]TMN19279.1 threonine/serine exporter family protein [Pseudoxanthomonas sp. X-1]UAY74134.1 threonine/serine exporter family protein [Pseudoxanthomonas sp. X-1]